MAVRYGAVRSAERYDSIFYRNFKYGAFSAYHPMKSKWVRFASKIDQWSISGRVDRASATEAVDTGSIPGRVKPKTIKIGIHSFPA